MPFRESLGDAPDGRLATAASEPASTSAGTCGYSYRGLSHFKAKFATRWESRDVVLPRGPSSLLALAALIRLHSGTVPPPAAAAPAPPSVPIGLEPAPLP